MNNKTELTNLIKRLSPVLNNGEYVFCTVNDPKEIERKDTICEFQEEEGTTLILEKDKADKLGLSYEFIASWITLKVHSSLEAVGLTAVFSGELARQNISCNVIAGYYHDHIFVHSRDRKKAMEALKALSKRHDTT